MGLKTADQALSAVRKAGRGAYKRYATAVRFFMSKASLVELVRAGLPLILTRK